MTIDTFFTHIAFASLLVVISFAVTKIMIHKVAIMDHPNDRSSHTVSVPRGGGIAIVFTFFIGMSAIYLFGDNTHINQRYMLGFVASSLLIAGVSFYDDIRDKTILFRLLSQIVAVIFVLLTGIVLDELSFPFFGSVSLGLFGYLFSFFWIIGLTNAYNFMDGLDGLIAGVTVIASLFLMAISYYEGSHFIYITCYTLLAGTIGFLFLNISPAKIFMGDVGSTFIGFTFATLAIIAARYDAHVSFFVVPLLLFNIIYDVIFTLIRRKLNRERITEGHRTHLYQLMNRNGFSHLEVSLVHYCMVFLQGLGAIWMMQIQGTNRLYIFIPFLVLQIIYTILVLRKAKEKRLL